MASGSSEPARGAAKAISDNGNAAPAPASIAPAPSAARAGQEPPPWSRGACRLTLDIIDAGGARRQAVVDPMESLLIGSGRSAGLRLTDPSVARVHCLLKLEAGELSALDLGSGQKTRVDGAPLQGARGLRPGSRLSIGEITLLIVSIEESRRGARHAPQPPVLEVRLFWKGELQEVAQRRRGVLRIGGAARNDLRCFAPQCATDMSLAHVAAGVATIHLPPGARLSTAPDVQDSAEGARRDPRATSPTRELTLRLGESARVEWGDFALLVQMREAPQRHAANRTGFDPILPLFLLFLAALAVLVWRFHESSIGDAVWADDFFADRQKIERWVVAVQPPSPPSPTERVREVGQAPADLDPAKALLPRQRSRAGRPGDKGPASREKVMRAGLLGVLGGSGGLGMAGVLGGGGGLGAGIEQALGQLKAGTSGQAGQSGLGSLGLRGMPGRGGGLGIGGLGTGPGGGGGGGEGGQGGASSLGRKKTIQRRVVPGKSVLAGSCERDVIGKVIGKNARQVLACYEAALTRSPDLAGKLAVRFTIEPTGRVGDLEITESTLDSPDVERCVENRIKRWRFPEPKGGGLCIVNYPWVFQQAGEGG